MYHKWQSYDVCFLRYRVRQTEYFVILNHFLPFYSPNNPKNQNFEKLIKSFGDIIILDKCAKNYDQMMYGSWGMVCDGCNYFSVWAIFCPFAPVIAQKIKVWRKWKRTPGHHHFAYVYQKLWSGDVRFLRRGAWQM